MASLTNVYASMDELKDSIGLSKASSDDSRLESLLTGACRAIDQWTGGRYYATTETRYYTPTDGYCLKVDDLLSIATSLKSDEDGDRTYEITWAAATDYYLEPVNAPLLLRPYTRIEVDPVNGDHRFPVGVRRGIQIIGSWGYASATPAPVNLATLRLAARLYKLGDAVLGVAGATETGVLRIQADRDLNELLWPYKREWGVG